MKKDTKKHIDAEINRVLLNDFDRVESFIIGKLKYLCIGAVAIIVLVGIGYGVMFKKERNENAVRQTLANASTKAELVEAIGKYGKAKEAEIARFRLAEIYCTEKNYTEAAAVYKTIAQTSAVNEVKARALLNEAFMFENSGKNEDAVKAFAAVGNNKIFPTGIRAEAFYSAVRLACKINKKDEAGNAFAQIKMLANDESAAQWVNLAKAVYVK